MLAFPVRAIGWVLAELPRSVAGWDRVQHGAHRHRRHGVRRAARPTPAAGRRRCAFDGVDFALRRRAGPVLHDVTFTCRPGRTVALVGPTGSGKSTIAVARRRAWSTRRAGTVALDGVDARELHRAPRWPRTVALVPQVPFVFDDTVRGNVALGPRRRRRRRGSGRRCGWPRPTGSSARLPDGAGHHGRRARHLALRRAAAAAHPGPGAGRPAAAAGARRRHQRRRPAGGGGDPGRAARSATQAASILVVAYRRATIALADEVVYLEHGRVVARGTHAELLATVPGYADLVTAYEQAEAEREREHAYDEDATVRSMTRGATVTA